jgi:tetratricopeptide (TPR) repeat protein
MTLNNIARIYDRKGEYEQALKLYNQSVEIAMMIGDQEGIATTLNNIAEMHTRKEEYEQALFHVLQARKILERLAIPELQRSYDILGYIKGKLESDTYENLVKKVEVQLS